MKQIDVQAIVDLVSAARSVTTKEVAEVAGVSKEKANRILKDLEAEGKISHDTIQKGAISIYLWKPVQKDTVSVDMVSVDDLTDAQFKAAFSQVNVGALAAVLTGPSGVRNRISKIHDRARELGLGKDGRYMKRMLRSDFEKFVKEYRTPDEVRGWIGSL